MGNKRQLWPNHQEKHSTVVSPSSLTNPGQKWSGHWCWHSAPEKASGSYCQATWVPPLGVRIWGLNWIPNVWLFMTVYDCLITVLWLFLWLFMTVYGVAGWKHIVHRCIQYIKTTIINTFQMFFNMSHFRSQLTPPSPCWATVPWRCPWCEPRNSRHKDLCPEGFEFWIQKFPKRSQPSWVSCQLWWNKNIPVTCQKTIENHQETLRFAAKRFNIFLADSGPPLLFINSSRADLGWSLGSQRLGFVELELPQSSIQDLFQIQHWPKRSFQPACTL